MSSVIASDSIGSVTFLINAYKSGDQSAASQLWEHYFQTLREVGDNILFGVTTADGDDAVIDAFYEVLEGESIINKVACRGDLTPILVTKTKSRAIDILRKYHAIKRKPVDLVSIDQIGVDAVSAVSREACPELVAIVKEEVEMWLGKLSDRERIVTEFLLDGFNVEQVAERTGDAIPQIEAWLKSAVKKMFQSK